MSMLKQVLSLALVVAVAACSQRLGDLTVASNKNIVLSSYNPSQAQPKQAEGKSCKALILGIPLGVPNVEDAIDDAMAKGGGNLMTDVVLTQTFWTALVYGQICMKASGSVWTVRTGQLENELLRELARGPNSASVVVTFMDGAQLEARLLATSESRIAVGTELDSVEWIDRDNVAQIDVDVER